MKLCLEVDYIKSEFYFRIVNAYNITKGALDLTAGAIHVPQCMPGSMSMA